MLQVCATRDAMSTLALKIKVIHVKNISQNMLRTTDGEIKIEQQEKKKKTRYTITLMRKAVRIAVEKYCFKSTGIRVIITRFHHMAVRLSWCQCYRTKPCPARKRDQNWGCPGRMKSF